MKKELKELIEKCEKEYDSLCEDLNKFTDLLENANLTDTDVKSIFNVFKNIENGMKNNRDRLYDYYDILGKIDSKNAFINHFKS